MKRLIALSLLALALPVHAAPPTSLGIADVPALLAPPTKGTKIVALWALDCAYCEQNLSALRTWQRSHADVDLVFVATDPVSQADTLEKRLRAAKVDDVPSRAYAERTPDRINFLIDQTWGGETPRTLVIHADGRRRAASGALDERRIAALVR